MSDNSTVMPKKKDVWPGEQGGGLHSVLDRLVVEPEALRRVRAHRALQGGSSKALILAQCGLFGPLFNFLCNILHPHSLKFSLKSQVEKG